MMLSTWDKLAYLGGFGYMTKAKAIDLGFTNHGRYYFLPIWIGDVTGEFMCTPKLQPLNWLMDIMHDFEAAARSHLYPEDEFSFMFHVGPEIEK
jgi:hypothetical protein